MQGRDGKRATDRAADVNDVVPAGRRLLLVVCSIRPPYQHESVLRCERAKGSMDAPPTNETSGVKLADLSRSGMTRGR